ncbi:LytR/AlgR family response regulator transcription factor [Chryseobacterium defluvii]|uniref:LytTR family two component transcriptional regulator n=1 Tax=Chryseobacterium defluvii TaxID=160396 RepID=A0A495SEC5_9FLAO|nr:LytTR family DNA-binding domain-containing protein [Chryseobacterium defluvii]RKS98216.1 LytTR family two component transcriptional regulator [Chryseobacterium defluvii]
MKIKCLLVDDEPLAIRLLETHLEKLDMFEVMASCNNAIKALEMLRTETIDLIFLDIKMPQISGIDFLKTLKNPPAVIVTTAYREYALDGYDLDIIDYLLKPITFDRFFKAIDRYLRTVQIQPAVPAIPVADQYIHIKSGGKFYKLQIEDILYVESLKDYITIHCSHQKIVAKYKISDMESELKPFRFLRIHRSFIVNPQKITAFTVHDVEIGQKEIPIGTNYKEYVFQTLTNNYSG